MSNADRTILIEEITKMLPKVARLQNPNYDPIEFIYFFALSVCKDVDAQED